VQVTAPDGRVWDVARRPGRSPRWRDMDDFGFDWIDLSGLFVGEALVIAAGLFLFAGPWRIEAATAGPPPELHSWHVRGLLRSRRAVREVATELERGDPDAAPEDAEP
jgi:hypothetical protein